MPGPLPWYPLDHWSDHQHRHPRRPSMMPPAFLHYPRFKGDEAEGRRGSTISPHTEGTTPAPVGDPSPHPWTTPARVRVHIYNKRQPARMKGENEEKNKKTPPTQHPPEREKQKKCTKR